MRNIPASRPPSRLCPALRLLPLACALTLRAEPEVSPERAANLQRVEAAWAQRQAAASEDRFVRRGVVADRKARTVVLDAEATGLEARGIVEFPIISENSAHDYEALFIAFAKPSDISAAIEFIGVPRGRPVQPAALAFWPKGERVRISVGLPDDPAVPIETLILDAAQENKPLPTRGFIHSGSTWAEADGQRSFAADGDGPGALAASYNEPTTVLDMPRQAQQGEVYERFVANPETLFQKGAFVRIEIVPEPRPEAYPRRVTDLVLAARAPEGAPEIGAARLRLTEAGQGPDTAPELPLADALRACRAYLPDRDPYVTLDLDDSLSIQAAEDLARVLGALDNEDGLRLEPPKPGQLYYKAFLPQGAWRDRAERPTQPCELRFARGADGKGTATLVRIEEVWSEKPDNWRPDLKVQEVPVPGPDALPALLAASDYKQPVLLVFAPGSLTLGDVMPYLRAVQATHTSLHVFVEP